MHDLAIGQNEMLDELMDELDNESGDSELDVELAEELLSINSEEELDQFFGNLVKGARKFIRSPAGKMLTGALRTVAKKALPSVAGTLGNMVVPGLGGMVGSKLGGLVASGLEMEALDLEEEQEMAKRVVQAARRAVQQAASDPRVQSNARAVVRNAIDAAFTGVLPVTPRPGARVPVGQSRGSGGRWYRRGNRIILVGV